MAKTYLYHPTPPQFAFALLAVTSCSDPSGATATDNDVNATVSPEAGTDAPDGSATTPPNPSVADGGVNGTDGVNLPDARVSVEPTSSSDTSEPGVSTDVDVDTPLSTGAHESEPPDAGQPSPDGNSPFSAVRVAAQSSLGFGSPRAGAPLEDGAVFVAATPITDDTPAQPAVFIVRGQALSTLYAGPQLNNPLDLDITPDGLHAIVADSLHFSDQGDEMGGALLRLSLDGGDPDVLATGYQPRAVTVASSGAIYFSGRDPSTGAVGVFRVNEGDVEVVHLGPPLVDPSGVAVFQDGSVLVADPRLGETEDPDVAATMTSASGVVLLKSGIARVFAQGFQTGYPAGIALTTAESHLVVSGQGPDSTNQVHIFDVHSPETSPYIERAFAAHSWSSGGLHRAHTSNQFVWCDRAANGGTLYAISAD